MGHLFISYSRQDRVQIDRLVDHLQRAHYDCWIDREEMRTGYQWRTQIVNAIKSCDIFILALSHRSIQSRDVRKELDIAEENQKRILPVMLQTVEIPPTMAYQLAGVQYIDLTRQYKSGIQKLLNDIPVTTSPTLVLPPQNIPRSGAVEFLGRDEDLAQLHQALQKQAQVAVCALSGMGGLGKTELAIQYAQKHWQTTYRGGVCWLRARDETVGIQLVEFAQTILELSLPDEKDLNQQVQWCWRHWPTPKESVLVVLDGVTQYDDIQPFLPPTVLTRFKVLITTRLQQLSTSIPSLPLNLLSPEAALALLGSFVGQDRMQAESNYAASLCQWLGYLPLGIELVGQYLRQRQDLHLRVMHERLEMQRLQQQALQKRPDGMTGQLDVIAAFELSWQALHPSGQTLSGLLSLFALSPIPWWLVEQCLPDQDTEALETQREEQLLNLSLLRRVETGTYQLHQLIREFFSDKLNTLEQASNIKRQYCRALVTVAQQVPLTPTRTQIATLSQAIPHVAEAATTLKDWLSDDDLIQPHAGLGRYYEGQGMYTEALPWFESGLNLCRQRLGKEHLYVALSINNLAGLCRKQGRYSEAESLYIKALRMLKSLPGEEHPVIADSLNNLAGLYQNQGRYNEAESLYIESLKMTKILMGEEHPDFAGSLNNLAGLYQNQGRYSEAESLYIKALRMLKSLLGEEHPSIAGSLNNLAFLYTAQGRYSEAETLHIQALKMSKCQLGQEHPYVISSLDNLAGLYYMQGRYSEAETLYIRVLKMRKHLLGQEHPDVASSLYNLATLYTSQGRYIEAEPLQIQALEMSQRLLGKEHPDVADSLFNMANIYAEKKQYSEAEPLFIQALEIRQNLLGQEHPDVASSLSNLALLYAAQGRYSEAEPLHIHALEMSQSLLDKEHPDVARYLNNLALLYTRQGQYSKAEPLFIQALEIRKRILGEQHPHTRSVYNRLRYLRRKKSAESFISRWIMLLICTLRGCLSHTQKILKAYSGKNNG